MQTHPASITHFTQDDYDFDSSDSDGESDYDDELTLVRQPNKFSTDKDLQTFIELLSHDDKLFDKPKEGLIPEFSLTFKNVEVVKFIKDLILNVDLSLRYTNIAGWSTVTKFDETVAYNQETIEKFHNLITKRKGYFEDDRNYFIVSKDKFLGNVEGIFLRNCRVGLFWRDIILSDIEQKKILTLGMNCLLGNMTRVQLLERIKSTLPYGVFDVSIKNVERRYVQISIERPIFSY